MSQSIIKKEWDYKYPILSSIWPATLRQIGQGGFQILFHQNWEKNTKIVKSTQVLDY